MSPRFLQIHSLTGYSATLLNRDDAGRAKRLPFGGYDRIRVSSQCLKRHWREATGEWSIQGLGSGRSVRSRKIFSEVIAGRLRDRGFSEARIVSVLLPLRAEVLGESTRSKQSRKKSELSGEQLLKQLNTEQIIVLGEPEIAFLTETAAELAQGDENEAAKDVKAYFKVKSNRQNLRSLTLGAGLDAALFGRMVTSDILARSDSAVHVAHSFTVHQEEAEPDYFSALDDIVAARGELGAGHINSSELTSGLFYSYVAIDLRQLVDNLSGDSVLGEEVLRRLIQLIATVSPGAKLGSTAPYACAELVLAEVGISQPRTLANAFRSPVSLYDVRQKAVREIGGYLDAYDAMYGGHERRKVASMIEPVPDSLGERMALGALADWAASQVCST